jgi:hypothetical protein
MSRNPQKEKLGHEIQLLRIYYFPDFYFPDVLTTPKKSSNFDFSENLVCFLVAFDDEI